MTSPDADAVEKQLRDQAQLKSDVHSASGGKYTSLTPAETLEGQAADTIAALRQQLAEAQADSKMWQCLCAQACDPAIKIEHSAQLATARAEAWEKAIAIAEILQAEQLGRNADRYYQSGRITSALRAEAEKEKG